METSKNQKQDRSLKYFHGEAASSAVENAGLSYQSPSIVATGAADKNVAFLITLSNLLLSFVLIKIPSMLDTCGSLKKLLLLFSFLSLITWIPLIAVLFFFRNITPAWLIVLWIVSLIPTLITVPLRDEWLAGKVPGNNLGRYLSVRSIISAVVYLSALFLMGFFLDLSGGRIFQGYAIVLFVAFTGSVVMFSLYKKISGPEKDNTHAGRIYYGFGDFLKEVVRGHMGKFVLYIALMYFAVNLCSAFFTVYMLKDLHFTYLTYTLMISAEYLARIISLTFWGRAIDRKGSLRVLGIISRFIPFVPVLWLFSSNIAYLLCVQLISGTIWAAFDLSNQTFIYQGAPRDLRLRYIVYHRSLSTFAIAAGALVGAFTLNYVYPIFGSQILGMFLLSGVVRFVVVAGLFPRLTRQVREETTLEEERRVPVRKSLIKKVIPDTGIHRLHKVIPDIHPAHDFSNSRRRLFVGDTAVPRGAFYHPEHWTDYRVRPQQASKIRVIPPQTGMYYYPGEWGKYKKDATINVHAKAVYAYDVQRLGLDKPVNAGVTN